MDPYAPIGQEIEIKLIAEAKRKKCFKHYGYYNSPTFLGSTKQPQAYLKLEPAAEDHCSKVCNQNSHFHKTKAPCQ